MTTYATATQVAHDLLTLLRPACDQIEIAGSVRRGKRDPKDIEIVAVPQLLTFDALLAGLDAGGVLARDPRYDRNGHRYKRRIFDAIPVDLFLVLPPAEWGLTLAIRTGPAEFSAGLLARWKRVSNGGFAHKGCLNHANGTRRHTPTEQDVFTACDLPYIEPDCRADAIASLIP